jgi:hypothetical protein
LSLARFVDELTAKEKKEETYFCLEKYIKTFNYSHNLEKREVGIGLGKWTEKN